MHCWAYDSELAEIDEKSTKVRLLKFQRGMNLRPRKKLPGRFSLFEFAHYILHTTVQFCTHLSYCLNTQSRPLSSQSRAPTIGQQMCTDKHLQKFVPQHTTWIELHNFYRSPPTWLPYPVVSCRRYSSMFRGTFLSTTSTHSARKYFCNKKK